MKKMRTILVAVCMFVCSIFATGCYFIQAQTMKNVKGTYKLTYYTTTTKQYVKNESGTYVVESSTEDTLKVNQIEYYFVVTGEDRGYYVYKDKDTDAYGLEVYMSYQSNKEDNKKYDYVNYRRVTEKEDNKLGISKNALHDSRIPTYLKVTLFGQTSISHTPGFDKTWTKVSDKTDLSYVKEQMGEFPVYGYEEWSIQGLHVMHEQYDVNAVSAITPNFNPYKYYNVIIDTLNMKATTYYALDSDSDATAGRVKESDIELVDSWATIQFNGLTWTLNEMGGYESEVIKHHIVTEKKVENEQVKEAVEVEYKLYTYMRGEGVTSEAVKDATARVEQFWTSDNLTFTPMLLDTCYTFVDKNHEHTGVDGLCDLCGKNQTEHATPPEGGTEGGEGGDTAVNPNPNPNPNPDTDTDTDGEGTPVTPEGGEGEENEGGAV